MKSTIQSKVLSYRIRCILGLLVITSFAYQVYNNKPGIIDRFVFADTVLAEDSTRAASPERYIYQVTPDDFTCGTTSPTQGIIKLRLQPNNSNHTLHGEIRKCDAGKFSKDGSAYISIHEGQQFGPYPYKSGDDVVRFTIDPVAQGIYGSNSYQAQVFPHDQNYPILSGFVEAEAYFSTTVTAQKNNSIWQDVGIWYSTTSGQPGGNGFYENFLPEGIGNWNFYVEKKTGYTITANYTYSEQPNYYRFNIPTGAQVTASFVPTTKPSAALDSNEQTAPCQWAIWIKLTGFTPNSQLIIRSDYSELACESGEFVTNSWTTTYGSPIDANGELMVGYLHGGTGHYLYTFTDSAGKSAALSFDTSAQGPVSPEPFDPTPRTPAEFAQQCLDEINVARVGTGATNYDGVEFQNTEYANITSYEVTAAICEAYRRNQAHIGEPISSGNGTVHWWMNGSTRSKYQVQNFCRKDVNGQIESNGSGGCKDDIIIYNPVARTAFLVRDEIWDKYRLSASVGGYEGVLGKLGGPVTDVLDVALDSSQNPKRYEATDKKADLIGYFEDGELVYNHTSGQLFDRAPAIDVYPYLGYRDVTIAHPFGWYIGQLASELVQAPSLSASSEAIINYTAGGFPWPTNCQTTDDKYWLACLDKPVTRGEFAELVAKYIYGADLSEINVPCLDYANTECFPNITEDVSEIRAIYALKKDGIIRGDSENLVYPERTITRGEAMSVVMRALMYPVLLSSLPTDQLSDDTFSDIAKDSTHGVAVLYGERFGIVSGYSTGEFKPDGVVTYGAAAKMLCKAFTSYCYDIKDSEEMDSKNLRDSEGWAYLGHGIKARTWNDDGGTSHLAIVDLSVPGVQVELAHSFMGDTTEELAESSRVGRFQKQNTLALVRKSGAFQPTAGTNSGLFFPFAAINGTSFECGTDFPNFSDQTMLAIRLKETNELKLYSPTQLSRNKSFCNSFFTYSKTHPTESGIVIPGIDDIEGLPSVCDIPDEQREQARQDVLDYLTRQNGRIFNADFAVSYDVAIINDGNRRLDTIRGIDHKKDNKTILGVRYGKNQAGERIVRYLYLATSRLQTGSESTRNDPLIDFAYRLIQARVEDAILLDGGESSQFYSVGRENPTFNKVVETGSILCKQDDSKGLPRKLLNSVVAYNESIVVDRQYPFDSSKEAEMQYNNNTVISFKANSFVSSRSVMQQGQNSQIYTTQFILQPQAISTESTLQGTEVSYDLSVWDANNQPAQLQKAYTVNIAYNASALPTNVDETKLALYYWNGTQWQKEPTSTVDVEANQITASPQRLGAWAVLAEVEPPESPENQIYLPVITSD